MQSQVAKVVVLLFLFLLVLLQLLLAFVLVAANSSRVVNSSEQGLTASFRLGFWVAQSLEVSLDP